MRREEPLPQLITHSSTVMGTNKDSGSVGVSHTSYVLFSRGGPESLHGRGSKAKKMPTLLPQQYSFSLPSITALTSNSKNPSVSCDCCKLSERAVREGTMFPQALLSAGTEQETAKAKKIKNKK